MDLTLTHNDAYQSLLEKSVARLGRMLSLEKRHCFQINLVLDEICTNIFEHNRRSGDLRIDISISSDGKMITIVIEDNGIPFDPTKVDEPDTSLPLSKRQAGGLGLYFVKQYTDSFEYARRKGRNRTTATLSLASSNTSPPSGAL